MKTRRSGKKRTTKRAIVVGKNEPGAGFRTTHTVRGIGRVIVVTAPDGERFEVYRLAPDEGEALRAHLEG